MYDVIFDHISCQDILLETLPNLDAMEVVSKFFESLIVSAGEKFKEIAEEERERAVSNYKKQFIESLDQKQIEETRRKFAFSTDRCQYCVAGPCNQDY